VIPAGSVTIQTLLQGCYSLFWIAIVLDVGSPSLDLRRMPDWSVGEALIAAALLLTLAVVIGTMMHTLSRHVFRRQKDEWATEVLMSPSVRDRYLRLGLTSALCDLGATSFDDLAMSEGPELTRRAGDILHGIGYGVMARAPHVYRVIQVYRDQYRLARGFVVPSVILALVLPIWEPVAHIPSGVMVGPLNLVGIQLFLLGILLSAITYMTFRERSYRYAAALTRAFVVLERQKAHELSDGINSARAA
jgi:ABC-type Co2+ transport system permease subunit